MKIRKQIIQTTVVEHWNSLTCILKSETEITTDGQIYTVWGKKHEMVKWLTIAVLGVHTMLSVIFQKCYNKRFAVSETFTKNFWNVSEMVKCHRIVI